MYGEGVFSGMICGIYNRCSTTELAQKKALEAQVEESRELVLSEGGILYKQYIESESGTTVKYRTEFQDMLNDIRHLRINCLIIKSQDRLMRNAADWHIFLREIMVYNVKLYIYLERKFYDPSEDAFLAGVKALMAEQFSRDLSIKENNAHKRRQTLGEVLNYSQTLYGYDKNQHVYTINSKEAYYVRMMFDLAEQGYGSRVISNILYKEGMVTNNGKRIYDATILRMLKAEYYFGRVVQNKLHYDFESKKNIKMPPDKWIVHDNAMPAIISKDTYDNVQKLIAIRKNKYMKKIDVSNVKGLHLHPLTGKIKCAECGTVYCRTRNRLEDGTYSRGWVCHKAYMLGRIGNANKRKVEDYGDGCDNIHLSDLGLEKVLRLLYDNYYNEIIDNQKTIIDDAISMLKEVFVEEQSSGAIDADKINDEINKLKKSKEVLFDKLVNRVISDTDFKSYNHSLDEKINDLTGQLEKSELQNINVDEIETRLLTIRNKIKKQKLVETAITFEMSQIIDEIIVHIDGQLDIKLNDALLINVLSELNGEYSGFLVNAIKNVTKTSDYYTIQYIKRGPKQVESERLKKAIYECLCKHPTWNAIKLAAETNMATVTARRKLNELQKEGKVDFIGHAWHGHYIILK